MGLLVSGISLVSSSWRNRVSNIETLTSAVFPWRGVPLPEGDLAYGPIGDKQVDAISGATQSSTAVTRTLNELKANVIAKWEVQ